MSRSAAAPSRAPRPAYLIGSVDSALRLLHIFLVRDRIRVSEAAAELDVAPSTAHRLLAMLQYHGFVAQDERGHDYVAGPDLIRFGLAAIKQLDIRQQARPIMEALSAHVDETVALGILQTTNVLYVDGVESTRALRVVVRTGALIPAHAIAMGKALLAWSPAERIAELYPQEVLPRVTDRTVSTKRELLAELESVRTHGYAQSKGESEDGVASIAVPVFNEGGELRATMSIAAPTLRVTPDRVKTWLPLLRAASAELGKLCR
jgi:DNA-binding IclR family transcriptional regulator